MALTTTTLKPPLLSMIFLKVFCEAYLHSKYIDRIVYGLYYYILEDENLHHDLSARPFTLCRGFFTPKIVGTFYMQGYKAKEKTAIVPPVSKLIGHPAYDTCFLH